MSDTSGQEAVKSVSTSDELKMESVMKRIPVKSTTITKMKRISSLFCDETGNDLKEAEMIAFFFEMSFDVFLKSGQIEKRIKSVTE
jgi:uncharacterized membrane protein